MKNCGGQEYDGEGDMAGQVNALSGIFLKLNPKALYTHW